MKSNPKTHDALFKWLITSFTKEFFAHYFSDVKIGAYRFIDKEFINKYEALKESIKGDLFLIMEVEIEDQVHEIIIQIEHKSEKEDPGKQVYKYSCYAWLLKEKPVWSIVIFTDETRWRKPVSNSYWIGYDSKHGKQLIYYDVIKVKAEKSADLITKYSLLCKLLALKADDSGTDRETLLRTFYQTTAAMKPNLNDGQMLLITQWIDAYSKIPEKKLLEIKKEVNMEAVATTITEHYINMGREEGRKKGREEGKEEGWEEGREEGRKIIVLNMLRSGLAKDQIAKMTALNMTNINNLEKTLH